MRSSPALLRTCCLLVCLALVALPEVVCAQGVIASPEHVPLPITQPSRLTEPGPVALPPIDALAAPRLPEQVFYEGNVPATTPFTPEWKPQWLQRVHFDWNTIEASGKGATLADTELALESTFAVPSFRLNSPLLITPHFGSHLLRGPEVTDLPPELYDVSLELERILQVAPGWQLETAVAPALYSDFRQGRSEALRVTGRVVAHAALSSTFEAVLGATYLARYDYPVLPVAGFVWAPSDRTRLDLVFPRPQFWQRICLPPLLERLVSSPLASWIGLSKEDEYWVFTTGSLGGNTYAIRRENGDSDMVTLRDFRFTLGYEIRGVLGFLHSSEIGYVFGRDLKYQSDPQHFTLTDALLLRSTYAF